MSKKETLEKFFKFMEKWRYEDFNAFENHFNKLMSMKSKEQLTNENEALKDSIAVILAQKKNVHKHCDEQADQIDQLKQQLVEKDKEIKKLNWQLKDKDFIIKNLNHSLSVAPNANAGQRARIDELTKIVKEKDKEINSLIVDYEKRISQEQELMSNLEKQLAEKDKEIENLKQEINEWVGHKFVKLQYQKAIQELEKAKMLTEWKFESIADVVNQIDQQIKELKGEKDERI